MAVKFNEFNGTVTTPNGKTLHYKVAISDKPLPEALMIQVTFNPGPLTFPLGDWPDLVAAVEELKRERFQEVA